MNGFILGEEAINNLLTMPPWPFLEAALNFVLLLYIVFALLVIRQISLLNSILGTGLSGTFKVFSYLHLILALGALVFSFLVV